METEPMDTVTTEQAEVIDNEFMLKNMILKTIIKENHGKEITRVIINEVDSRYSNLVATVGDVQANVYDNRHMGDYLDLMLHFVNKPLPFAKKGAGLSFNTCTWIRESGSDSELLDDAYLALGGEDCFIHIVSVKRTKVIAVLQGHTDEIVDLIPHPTKHNLLLSASKDGTVRLWDIHAKKPKSNLVHKWDIQANVLAVESQGKFFICGCNGGEVTQVKFPVGGKAEDSVSLKIQDKRPHTGNVDCVKFLGDNVVSKSVDGKIIIWDTTSGKVETEIRVPHSNRSMPSRFDISSDGQFICVGNGDGHVYIYRTDNGKQINHLEHKRSKTPVRCCAISQDCKNVLYVTNDSHIWRYDYIHPKDLPSETSA